MSRSTNAGDPGAAPTKLIEGAQGPSTQLQA
jgi:hypothetical protein